MLGSRAYRILGVTLALAALSLTACGALTPAAPTPTPVAKPAGVGRAGGGGPGGNGPGGGGAQATGGAGQGQGQGRGQGQGQGQGRGADANGGAGQGQGQGQGPGGFGRGAGGAQASASPNPFSPNINGEVDIVEGRILTVATNTGWRKVQVSEAATITTEGKGTTSDLVQGAFVGVTSKPDGTASMIRLFSAGVTPRTGQFPMNGSQAGNTMTNAKIEAFDGKLLTLDYSGEKASIAVMPETEIVKPVPASLADLTLNTRIQVSGTVTGDLLDARTVTILTGQRGRG